MTQTATQQRMDSCGRFVLAVCCSTFNLVHQANPQAPEESKARLLDLLADGSPAGARVLATAERLIPAIADSVSVIKVPCVCHCKSGAAIMLHHIAASLHGFAREGDRPRHLFGATISQGTYSAGCAARHIVEKPDAGVIEGSDVIRQVAPLRLRPGDVADYQRYFLRERAARGGASKRPKLSPEVCRFSMFKQQDSLLMTRTG